jgi:hypothetical protein
VNLITPVHLFETGDAVANLHAGLLFLVLGQSLTPDDRRMIQDELAPDVNAHPQLFGMPTFRLVKQWQEGLNSRRHLVPPNALPKDVEDLLPIVTNGDVDQGTANVMNVLIRHHHSLAFLTSPLPSRRLAPAAPARPNPSSRKKQTRRRQRGR